jgi:hypothetical protein
MSDASPQTPPLSRRKFLVIVDQTPECKVALRFASRRAQHTGGIVTLLYVVAPADFQQWAGVERMMREEAHEEAERALHEAAKTVNDIVGSMPELVIRDGRAVDEIRELLKEDRRHFDSGSGGGHLQGGPRSARLDDCRSGWRRLFHPRDRRAGQPYRRTGRRARLSRAFSP